MGETVKNVAVIASSTTSNNRFDDDGQSLGDSLARQGYQIIIPGEADSIKGAVVSGAIEQGGEVINIRPDPKTPPYTDHRAVTTDPSLKKIEIVEGEDGVKSSLSSRGDIAVLLQGGLRELSEAMHVVRQGVPLIVVNESGFYDGLQEQIETIKEHNRSHDFSVSQLDHVHFVDEVGVAIPIIEVYKASGTPNYDQASEWSMALAQDKFVRKDRAENMPGFTHRGDTHILSKDAGIIALDRMSTLLDADPNAELIVDNSTGYYDGLLAQFETYTDEGAEKVTALQGIKVVEDKTDIKTAYMHTDDDGPDFSENVL